MTDVVAKQIDGDTLENPGDYFYLESQKMSGTCGIEFKCPCGCGRQYMLLFTNYPTIKGDAERWKWDGNNYQPTLTPSIHNPSGCGYHGHLKAGIFRSC